MSLSTSIVIIGTSFAARIVSIDDLDESDLTKNLIVTIMTGSLLAVTLLGLVIFIMRDNHEYLKAIEKKKLVNSSKKGIHSLFDVLLPVEFSNLPWTHRWWKKMLEEHDWLCLLRPYQEGEHFKSIRWMLAIGKILNRFFIMTLLANLYFRDDGYCISLKNESSCLMTRHLDQVDTLCIWVKSQCKFNYIYPTFFPLLILVIIICILTLPLDNLYEYCLIKIQYYADSTVQHVHLQNHVEEDPNLIIADDEIRVNSKGLSANVLLVARLEVLRDKMDRLTVQNEMAELLHESRPDNWYAANSTQLATGFLGEIWRAIYHLNLRMNNSADPITASNIMHSQKESLILSRLKKARRKAYLLKMSMRTLHSEQEKEAYLLQAFMVHSMQGFSHYCAHRHIFEEFEEQHNVKKHPYIHYICMVIVPIYITCLIFYIFLFGSSLKAKTANFWFTEILIVTLMSNFIILPLVIYIKHIVVIHWARKEMLVLLNILRIRGKAILRRSTGMVTQSGGLMHHFNPACRTARQFPLLPASRLIIGLNDFDTPSTYLIDSDATILSVFFKFSFMPFVVIFLLTFLLPYTIQDAFIEAVAISGFLFGVYSSYVLARMEVYIPLVAIACFFIIGIATYCFMRHKHEVFEQKQYKHSHEDEVEDREIGKYVAIDRELDAPINPRHSPKATSKLVRRKSANSNRVVPFTQDT